MPQQDIPETIRTQAVAQGAVPYVAADGRAYLVVQHAGVWRVFVNVCPHRRLPLDRAGQVFMTEDRTLLVCANHGARFDPVTGECVAGPCAGKRLQRVPALEAAS